MPYSRSPRLSRRALLRGLGGTAVALPLLECMGTGLASAATTPARYLVAFGGFSVLSDSANPGQQAFVPDALGADYDLKAGLSPLGGFADAQGDPVRDRISVVSNLSIPYNATGPTPPGGMAPGDAFHWHCNALLTGNRQLDTFDARCTGPSSDQIVAERIGLDTTFRSLTYRVQASLYNASGGIEKDVWRTSLSHRQVNGQTELVTPQVSPKQAYDTLFTGFAPTDPAEAAARAFELRKRRSVLDLVDRNLKGLLPRLSQHDKQRLERHYDEIRELENLLASTPPEQTGACALPVDPGADPPVGGDFGGPSGWNVNDGYSDEGLRADVFVRLLHMAFTCDLTRSATLMLTTFQSFMNATPIVGAQKNCHILNHNGSQSNLDALIAWHTNIFGDLVARLRDTPEGDGSVLDSCALVFLVEGGIGPNSHATDDMVALVAGGAGGLVQGQHIRASNGTHPAQLLVGAMNAVGANVTSLGEIQGEMSGLRG